ncbi:hypothetical protein EMPS_01558 [Entomortierella parvispora]|uniref:Secreted protein n=1 Tax=Entomortierella parvispora TaxID=205924 RepID=A0A9P3H3T0_9FUNG|nr:hypothetical protein EMPS_01558 [Entomortierella parvispora]
MSAISGLFWLIRFSALAPASPSSTGSGSFATRIPSSLAIAESMNESVDPVSRTAIGIQTRTADHIDFSSDGS